MNAPKKIWMDPLTAHAWETEDEVFTEQYIRADLVDGLVKALEPFSMLLKEHHRDMPDNQPIYGINDSLVTAGDLRNARAALKAMEEE